MSDLSKSLLKQLQNSAHILHVDHSYNFGTFAVNKEKEKKTPPRF